MEKRWIFLLGFLLLSATLMGSCAPTSENEELTDNASILSPASTEIIVSFKTEWNLAQRWVSPSTYDIVHEGHTLTVEAKAQVLALDAEGHLLKVMPEWISEDPDMVVVSPGKSDRVKITVQRAGDSRLQVNSGGESLLLHIRATYQDGNSMRVEIFQLCGGHHHEEPNNDT